MIIRYKKIGDTTTVFLEGELDHHSAADAKEKLDKIIRSKLASQMVLDMKEMTFMDSAGIGVLLSKYKQFKKMGGKMYVKNLNNQTDKLFKIAGLYQVLRKID